MQNITIFKISGATLSIALCIFVLFSIVSKSQQKINGTLPTISYIEKIDGLQNDTKIDVQYFSKKNSLSIKTISKQDHPVILLNRKIEKIIKENRYRVDYTLTSANGNYIDISVDVNKDKNSLKTVLSGLNAGDKVAMLVNDQIHHTATPADWAGHIELSNNIVNTGTNNTICLHINETISLCHLSPPIERQAS